MKKAQISVDLIIVLSILLIIFMSLFATIFQRNTQIASYKKQYYARSLSDKAASEINSVFLAGSGATKTIGLPESMKDNTNYNISIYPNARIVEIRWMHRQETRHYGSPIITSNITGTLTEISDDFIATNNNGVVEIG